MMPGSRSSDPDPDRFRVVGSGPDLAGTKMSRSGLDPAGSENCGSGAPQPTLILIRW